MVAWLSGRVIFSPGRPLVVGAVSHLACQGFALTGSRLGMGSRVHCGSAMVARAGVSDPCRMAVIRVCFGGTVGLKGC